MCSCTTGFNHLQNKRRSFVVLGFINRGLHDLAYIRFALQRTSRGIGKMYVVMIVRCIRTENFPLHEIGTWEKVRYNGGYVVNGVRCNATRLNVCYNGQ